MGASHFCQYICTVRQPLHSLKCTLDNAFERSVSDQSEESAGGGRPLGCKTQDF